jgi:hypothetical protein
VADGLSLIDESARAVSFYSTSRLITQPHAEKRVELASRVRASSRFASDSQGRSAPGNSPTKIWLRLTIGQTERA